MSLTRQDYYYANARLQGEINRLFGNSVDNDSSSATATFIPPVDIYDYSDRFELDVDLPGVDPSTVELTLDGGVLALSGKRVEKPSDKPGDEAQACRNERVLGTFYRRFVLPDTADGEKVNASGKNGVLRVTIPKQAKAMPRRIQIAA